MKRRFFLYILLFFLIFFLIFLLYFLNKNKNYLIEKFEESKNAFVVLTRGYDNFEKYNLLIERNKSIYDVFYSKLQENNKYKYDIIIFNEGNITLEQQKYIQNKTPYLPLIFITIKMYDNNFKNKNICPETVLSNSFSNGYKNMCYFWSIDFLNYLKDYNYIIRIDEDCIIEKLYIDIIDNYKNNEIMFSSPSYQDNDDDDVIVGMNQLFNNYLIEHNISQKNLLKMPYTNFMIVNIYYFNNNNTVKDVLNIIKESNCIFSNRWGDLPIWGYILSYFIDKKYFIEDQNIVYYHGSHDKKIN
jgi:hypothetical protein